MAPPVAPAIFNHLPRLGVERNPKAKRRPRIGVIGRRHAQVHDGVAFLPRELLLLPHVREEALDAPVVEALGEAFAASFAARVVDAGLALGHAVFGELVQRVRPVVPVDEVEVGVAGMVGDCAPVLRILHAVDDRAVAAGGLAEAAAVLPARERAETAVNEGNDLAREVVGVVSDRGGVHVLVAAERGEAVREDEDRGSHLLLVDEPRGALRDVVAEGLPVGVRKPRAGEADEVVEHREAALVDLVILRRQPNADLAHVRVAKRIALEDLRAVLEDHQGARGTFGAFQ